MPKLLQYNLLTLAIAGLMLSASPAFASGGTSGSTTTTSTTTQPIVVVAPVVGANSLFATGFETLSFAGWDVADTGTLGMWNIETTHYSGKVSAGIAGVSGGVDRLLLKKVSTDSNDRANVTFFYRASGFNTKTGTPLDQFIAEYTIDGQTWTPMLTLDGQTTTLVDGNWHQAVAMVPASAGFQFRLRAHLSGTKSHVWIDDIDVRGDPTERTAARCHDGIDNDRDGFTDVSDSECIQFYSVLTVTKIGTGIGTVTSLPVGISCGTQCVGQFLKTALVTLSQVAARGSKFIGWTGACIGIGSCSVAMDADNSVTAEFAALPAYTLTVANNLPSQGTITSFPAGISCGAVCATTAYQDEQFTLFAQPAFGFDFVNWTGDCTGVNQSCALPITGNMSAVANYAPKTPGICGNTVVEWNEQCDDGNTISGDGCSAICTNEFVGGFGW